MCCVLCRTGLNQTTVGTVKILTHLYLYFLLFLTTLSFSTHHIHNVAFTLSPPVAGVWNANIVLGENTSSCRCRWSSIYRSLTTIMIDFSVKKRTLGHHGHVKAYKCVHSHAYWTTVWSIGHLTLHWTITCRVAFYVHRSHAMHSASQASWPRRKHGYFFLSSSLMYFNVVTPDAGLHVRV